MSHTIIKNMTPPSDCEHCYIAGYCLDHQLGPKFGKRCPAEPAETLRAQKRVNIELCALFGKDQTEQMVKEELAHNVARMLLDNNLLNFKSTEDVQQQQMVYSTSLDIGC